VVREIIRPVKQIGEEHRFCDRGAVRSRIAWVVDDRTGIMVMPPRCARAMAQTSPLRLSAGATQRP